MFNFFTLSFEIFFSANSAPVCLCITWWTVPNLPSPKNLPITKSSTVVLIPVFSPLSDFKGSFILALMVGASYFGLATTLFKSWLACKNCFVIFGVWGYFTFIVGSFVFVTYFYSFWFILYLPRSSLFKGTVLENSRFSAMSTFSYLGL